jgi:hypothetical protein
LAAQNEAELALILGTDNTQAGQVEATKLALRTGNQFIFHAIVKVATPREISVYPVLAKVHTIVKAQLPTVGAQELLKSAGAVSNAALTRLSSALPVGTLISVLKGNLPSVATLAEFYSAYSSAISMGQQVIRFSLELLTSDIGSFSAFVTFIVTFFAALGLIVSQLFELVSSGTKLALRLGPMYQAHVLRINLTVALETSLSNFASAVETWFKVPAVGRPPQLVAAVDKLREAHEAMELTQQFDMSTYGFGPAPAMWATSASAGHFQPALTPASQTGPYPTPLLYSGPTSMPFQGAYSGQLPHPTRDLYLHHTRGLSKAGC